MKKKEKVKYSNKSVILLVLWIFSIITTPIIIAISLIMYFFNIFAYLLTVGDLGSTEFSIIPIISVCVLVLLGVLFGESRNKDRKEANKPKPLLNNEFVNEQQINNQCIDSEFGVNKDISD